MVKLQTRRDADFKAISQQPAEFAGARRFKLNILIKTRNAFRYIDYTLGRRNTPYPSAENFD